MHLKDMIRDVMPLHSRRIEIQSFPVEKDRIVVEGRLSDERMINIYRAWEDEPRPAGPVHGMRVRFLVGEFPLAILDAEAEMPTVPTPLCRQARESVRKLIGEKIISGYSERVRDIIGGVNGCTHLTHLAVVMGPAAVHGFWTLFAQHARPRPASMEEMAGLEYIINSCHLWTPDGPFMEDIRKSISSS